MAAVSVSNGGGGGGGGGGGAKGKKQTPDTLEGEHEP